MHLTHLSLTNFRNFTRLDLDMPRGVLMLVGANAQGKTSLLEAIYLLATFVSFHASHERQLINFFASREPLSVARIVADFQRANASHRLEVRLIQEANGMNGGLRLRKEVLLDGVKYKVSEALGQFNAVIFLPQMLRIIEGPPEDRRRYLNLVLAQVISSYPSSLSEYTHALTQRNALLKQLNERGGDLDQLIYWDEQLASAGAHLIFHRIRSVQDLEHQAARLHRELTRGGEVLRLSYAPAYDPLPRPPGQFSLPLDAACDRTSLSMEHIRQGFLESLGKLRLEEVARGVTTIGPHRDEMRFLSNGIDLGTFGSRGQVRTAVLALKLAEVAWMKERTGHYPVLLLDEVLAELDMERRADLLERLFDSEQALLTTTDLDHFSQDFVSSAKVWRIHNGLVGEGDRLSE